MLFEFKDIGYVYPDGTSGLDRISGWVGECDRLAILGTNGSGKSTLLRVLNGLVEPTSGSLTFDGHAINERTLKEPGLQRFFRSRVGFVFQDADAQLFNATVAEEVGFAPSQLGLSDAQLRDRVEATLGFLGIHHLADRAPFRLSGGEKRKVAIASVLAMNPDAILFDEPFTGLDPRSQNWLVQTLRQLQQAGKTTIVATHSLDRLPLIADEALVLKEDHSLVGRFGVAKLLNSLDLLQSAGLAMAEAVTP